MTDGKPKRSAISAFFIVFIVAAILIAGFTDRMQQVGDASFQACKDAVNLSISLIGIMALWLGLVRVLEAGGLMESLARGLRPLMVRLFPDVPAEHPAMGAMVLNISANMLGLGNAATPLGIKAMIELNRLNPLPGVATNAMCLFVAIHASSVTIFPLGVIGVRVAAKSSDPVGIFLPTLVATLVATVVGALTAITLAKRDKRYLVEISSVNGQTLEEGTASIVLTTPETAEHDVTLAALRGERSALSARLMFAALVMFLCLAVVKLSQSSHPLQTLMNEILSAWLMPGLMLAILAYGVFRGVQVYDAVTIGAKAGFETAVRIFPFLVVMMVAIAMFRASGAMDLLVNVIQPISNLIGMPAETLPMAIIRPLSGSGAFAYMSELVNRDPNSYAAFVASTMQGATDTTFYILAVYFGAVGATRIRHALVAGLAADIAGTVSACLICRLYWTLVYGGPV